MQSETFHLSPITRNNQLLNHYYLQENNTQLLCSYLT